MANVSLHFDHILSVSFLNEAYQGKKIKPVIVLILLDVTVRLYLLHIAVGPPECRVRWQQNDQAVSG